MMSVHHQSNCTKAAKGAWESGRRSPSALLLAHCRLFKSLSVAISRYQYQLVLTPGNVHLYHHSKLQHAMDTTDDFHVYRVVIQGADMQVFVDDVLRINAPGTFTPRSGYNKNELAFGACNSPGRGEAMWSHVRACTQNASLHDAVVQVRFRK